MGREYDDCIEDREEVEVPDVPWAENIRNIENPIIQEREIEAAEKLLEEKKELGREFDAGEIDQIKYEAEIAYELGTKMARAATRTALESVGITYDHLSDISEDQDILATGDPKLFDLKDQVKEKITELGPEAAQELADRMLEEEKISEESHESISRQVRLQKDSQK